MSKKVSDLKALYKSYQSIKKNPDLPFEQFLAKQGFMGGDFADDQWMELLDSLNLDPDEQASFWDRIEDWRLDAGLNRLRG